MKRISLFAGEHFPEDFFRNYSKFKHGSKTQAREFGRQLAAVCDFPENSNLVIYSAPHDNLPTASNALKDYLISFCCEQFVDKNITVHQSKIDREYSYDDDYGKMSKSERRLAISSDIMQINKSSIKKEDILVFIDDILITGSHEERVLEVLTREGIENQCIFIYLAQYLGSDPTIEHELNHRIVCDLRSINDIIRNEEFVFNTRVVKFILKSPQDEFVSFITYQSETFRETLMHYSVLNGYHKNEKYSKNFSFLRDSINRWHNEK